MRRWMWVICLGMGVVMVGGLLLFGHLMQARERHIRVGRDTTFVSGPLDAWGYVDYIAAANEEFSTGVTKENNAAVVLVQATGIEAVMPGQRAAWLKGLGLKEGDVPEKGFVKLGEVMTERKGESKEARQQRMWNEEDLRRKKAWKETEDAEAAAWIKRNEGALALVKEASLRERNFEPLLDGAGMGCLIDALMPGLGDKRELANVLAARAMMRLGAGDRAGWRDDVMTLARYGRLLMQGQTFIQRLVGMAVERMAQDCAWQGFEGMGGKEAREILSEIRGMPAMPTLAESVDKVERLEPLGELSAMAKYGNAWAAGHSGGSASMVVGGRLGDGIVPVNFERWMRNSNRLSDMEVTAMDEKTYTRMKADFAAAETEMEQLSHPKGMIISSVDRAAAKLLSIMYPSFSTLAKVEQEMRMRRELTEIGLVLAMDRERRGGYVERLAELPSEEVRGADEDFFSGGKLVYRREGKGYVLYSVGKNERDDGGVMDGPDVRVEEASNRKDDVVLRVGG
jgi:hypothetical protein